jgi:hypothetical protein
MKISLADLVDRYTILKLKVSHGLVDAKVELIEVLAALMESASKASLTRDVIETYIDRLHIVNGNIWALEADIRDGKEEFMSLQEVGRRALAIRDKNRKRVAIKNEIVAISGEGFPDLKTQHASA